MPPRSRPVFSSAISALCGRSACCPTRATRWTVGDYVVSIDAGDGAAVRVERGGRQLKDVPAAVRRAPDYAEITEARDALRAQLDRVRRRLERAMALGETFDAASFTPALTTPAGQALVPRLVLRGWPAGAAEP